MKRRFNLEVAATVVLAFSLLPALATAQDVTLRLHQFLPPVATIPAKILKPWGERLAELSEGRIKIQHFDAMALGGRPPELMDQARDGVVDISMTLVGYTPGRFPRTEVFELPFMMTDPVATSLAYWQMVEEDFQQNEYADVKVLGAWVHGAGVIHTDEPVAKLEDMKGKLLRGPTRIVNDLLSELGATPVGMPLPSIPEALSKSVVNGTVLPWEVTPSIRLTELVDNHTEFGGAEALYTATIVLVMNKDKYAALPDDLRAILDAESGARLSGIAGQVLADNDKPGRDIAVASDENVIWELDEAEVARWKAAAEPVVTRWVADMSEKDIDGEALIERAKALIVEKAR
ncbi:TRAP transporter substrate-binding protein [Granulosicoccus antarcticus]|uniref:Solute-binding protein n=1 Tax=Granulosicoccus antarcticus IMCC3135 TaxID=1192854 RepID=A0A2Z2NS47_9GAMM|nr:TRAP transporter substrate-binding protein [Granulosicoccus antarcticus]ASJ74302.1 Solute-binding protein [Granulosicoccus antarcticus IMCC3135]